VAFFADVAKFHKHLKNNVSTKPSPLGSAAWFCLRIASCLLCRMLRQQAGDAGRRLAHKNNGTPQLDHIVIFTVLHIRTLKKK
jgi:hypothetical protein